MFKTNTGYSRYSGTSKYSVLLYFRLMCHLLRWSYFLVYDSDVVVEIRYVDDYFYNSIVGCWCPTARDMLNPVRMSKTFFFSIFKLLDYQNQSRHKSVCSHLLRCECRYNDPMFHLDIFNILQLSKIWFHRLIPY